MRTAARPLVILLAAGSLLLAAGHAAAQSVPSLPPADTPSPTPSEAPTPAPVPSPTQPPAPSPTPSPTHRPTPTPTPRLPTSTELAVRSVSGMGMYVWRWDRTGPVDAVVDRAKASGMSFIVVRASSDSEGLYLAPILAQLLPRAHAAGLKVVAYDPPRFEDVEADARRAYNLIAFRAAGQGIDAFAADIEPRWQLLTPDNADRYGAWVRQLAGPRFPLVGIVYPPNLVGDRFPFAAVARHFDVLAPMSYWRARTLDGPGFVAASVQGLAALGRPVSVIGQAFSYAAHPNPALRGHPARPELEASITAARMSGAIGMSFWVWESAEAWVFDSVKAAAWHAVGGEVATPPPPPPPPPAAPLQAEAPGPPAQTPPATPADPTRTAPAQAFGPPAPAPAAPARAPTAAAAATFALMLAIVSATSQGRPLPAAVLIPTASATARGRRRWRRAVAGMHWRHAAARVRSLPGVLVDAAERRGGAVRRRLARPKAEGSPPRASA